jgi:hypothetical protein
MFVPRLPSKWKAYTCMVTNNDYLFFMQRTGGGGDQPNLPTQHMVHSRVQQNLGTSEVGWIRNFGEIIAKFRIPKFCVLA